MMRWLGYFALAALVPPALPAQSLIVANMGASTASIIDLPSGQTVATLPTGHTPHEVAVSHDGKWAVVTDYGDRTVGSTMTVINVAARTVARTISVAPHLRPHGAAFLPDNNTLVVTAEREGAVLFVDVAAGTVRRQQPTGAKLGHMVVLSPDFKTAYVANVTDGALSILDLAGTADPVVIPVGPQTEGIGLSADGRLVWMGSNTTGKVFVVDVTAHKVIDSVQTPSQPYRIAFTPDNRTAVISNPESDEVRLVDVATRKVRAVIAMNPPSGESVQPQGIIVSPRGDKAWITLGKSNQVAELDLTSGKVTRWMTTDAGPDGIGYARQ